MALFRVKPTSVDEDLAKEIASKGESGAGRNCWGFDLGRGRASHAGLCGGKIVDRSRGRVIAAGVRARTDEARLIKFA